MKREEPAAGPGRATRTGASGKRRMICLSCPIGCHLEVAAGEDGELKVTGNRCPKGLEYAREEYFSPKRIVTATCRSRSARMPRVPVRTTRPLAVGLIDDLLAEIYAVELEPPRSAGDAIVRDFRGTGVDVVLSTSLS
jgi:CxxC motif-containing protein